MRLHQTRNALVHESRNARTDKITYAVRVLSSYDNKWHLAVMKKTKLRPRQPLRFPTKLAAIIAADYINDNPGKMNRLLETY